uniref:Uncharacterized protein n=2 Tax=Photinus pyralis TaxID=7054 RepID=A0A1Y1KDT7_PHOPY
MKAHYDKRRRKATAYKVGDLVLWRAAATDRADTKVSHKLANKFDGPYRIAKVMPNDRYLIEAIKGVRGYKRFQATVAVDSLRRYPCMGSGEYMSGENDSVNGDTDAETDRLDLLDLLES